VTSIFRVLREVADLLGREGRLSLRLIRREYDLGDDDLDAIVEELTVVRGEATVDNGVLVAVSTHRIDLRQEGGEQPATPSPGAADRRRRLLLGIALAVGAIVVAVVIPVVTPERVSDGRQVADAEPLEIGSPESDGWVVMVPLAADDRTGFPTPVVNFGPSTCIGFARVDFGPDDVRPSLARCVPAAPMSLGNDEIRLLVSIKSGFDTWHFIEAGNDVALADVATTSDSIDPSRVYLADAIIGLRLENGVSVARLSWSTIDGSYECESNDDAWKTGAFCP